MLVKAVRKILFRTLAIGSQHDQNGKKEIKLNSEYTKDEWGFLLSVSRVRGSAAEKLLRGDIKGREILANGRLTTYTSRVVGGECEKLSRVIRYLEGEKFSPN